MSTNAKSAYTNHDRRVASNTLDIVGIDVVNCTLDQALEALSHNIKTKAHQKITFLNAHNANVAKTDHAFSRILPRFLTYPDGIGVDIAAKLLHGEAFKANLNGTDFIPALLAHTKSPIKVGLYGAAPGIADKAKDAFSNINPIHDIEVLADGFIDPDEQRKMLIHLEAWKPDILLVAKGVPKQEIWIANHITNQHCTLVFGVGALFDFMAGNAPRAPFWVRKLRAEWVYRLLNEPARLAKRYIIGNPVFLARVLQYKFTGSRN